jgi:hypothetical protein
MIILFVVLGVAAAGAVLTVGVVACLVLFGGLAPNVIADDTQRLRGWQVGTWDGDLLDGSKATITFHAGGTLSLIAMRNRGGVPQTLDRKGRWTAVRAAKQTLWLRMEADGSDAMEVEHIFSDQDHFTVGGPGGGAQYRRR